MVLRSPGLRRAVPVRRQTGLDSRRTGVVRLFGKRLRRAPVRRTRRHRHPPHPLIGAPGIWVRPLPASLAVPPFSHRRTRNGPRDAPRRGASPFLPCSSNSTDSMIRRAKSHARSIGCQRHSAVCSGGRHSLGGIPASVRGVPAFVRRHPSIHSGASLSRVAIGGQNPAKADESGPQPLDSAEADQSSMIPATAVRRCGFTFSEPLRRNGPI